MRSVAADPGPIERHLEALRQILPGPARPREDLLRELADGLEDQTEAYQAAGLSPIEAEARAVRESGPVAELAAEFAAELTAAQGRRTGLLLAVTGPSMLYAWDVLVAAGAGWRDAPPIVRLLSTVTDVASYGFAVVGLLAFLLLTWWARQGRDGRWVVRVLSVVGTLGVLTVLFASAGMNVLEDDGQLVDPGWFLPLALVSTASSVVLAVQLRSLWRSLRGLRALPSIERLAVEVDR